MPFNLNDADMTRLDAGRMRHFLAELPEMAEAAYRRGTEARLPIDRPDRILIAGMGGSAISGDLIRTLALAECPVPVVVHRGDQLPAFADARTLAVFMTYSGNTGETMACMKQAVARGVPTLVVTSGGEAGKLAEANGIPVVSVAGGWQPRAALGDLFFALLGVMSQVPGFPEADVAEAVRVLRATRDRCHDTAPAEANPAKQLAASLLGTTPFVVGAAGTTEAVALRWKCQINENGKQTAFVAVLPEMTHNDIVNLTAERQKGVSLVVLEDPADSTFVSRQREIALELITPHVEGVFTLAGEGRGLLARQLSLILLGDYVSVYMGFLKGFDPTPVAAIGTLKQRMQVAMQGA